MTHAEKARELFLEGYNCCQAVAVAFEEEIGIDRETIARMASAFGGGMGRMREVCGCFSGMVMAAGALKGYSDPKSKEEKAELYARIQELAVEFKKDNGSIICRELLGGKIAKDTSPVPEERTEEYYKKRPCPELAGYAAGLLERKLKEAEDKKK
ncbi:MAG: C_GCAxxG_C_C family protein [Lachnospiraceae bacterium]|nr:C_GCAxxG_C_C family protein [Lachnospiraceae bacterium]